ncbi:MULTISPECIES: D-arabinono-1,4-lactone oxidase [unclassified Nocardioides]|uniref:D-arabinono-1,4-lactone oxidase n=1 Tax=unclassified Nocardioides TaxID=2615069 RepID=UPI0009EF850A|nr:MULTISPECIES: D-arabinono-1,4-lactone oxidase [unclassified Nocardioides]GAW52183.1 Oxidoreductase [Nocardioides sp. PD653-B2]GAW57492.1 Oxidoreductase [Nocardioides sp. PD653]
MSEWRNWSGLESASPARVEEPADTAAIVAAVERARSEGTTVKMVGTGHSFTAISAPEHTLLRPTNLGGIVAVDRDAMTATALAGTQLTVLNEQLAALGLSLHNMGDIDQQTLAGATSTGTHGTGGVWASLSAQVCGLSLVTGTGEVVSATEAENPELLEFARVGLGALGVLTTLTFRVEPLFVLEANETPMSWDECLDGFDERTAAHHHVDTYWFPHTDRMLSKTNDRLAGSETAPLSRLRHWWDDEFLSNSLFGALNHVTNRVPGIIPRFNQVSSRLLSARTYSDVAHRVFISPRDVVFREMEYAVPREAGLTALREARAALEASDLRITFPVEIRVTPADDIPLSTSSGRDSIYLAFHTHRDADHLAYFALIEPIMRAHDGRPHWGKVHTRTAADLAPAYPRFAEFLALRDTLDPDRVFANPYLRRVLGE